MGRVSHGNGNGRQQQQQRERMSEVRQVQQRVRRWAVVASRMGDGEMKGTLADQHGHGACRMPALGGNGGTDSSRSRGGPPQRPC